MSDERERWKRRPPDVRRREILDSAAELILTDGFRGMTMAAVADHAGVAKGTVYLYFDSKQELLSGLQTDLWERMLAGPAALAGRDDLTWRDRLDALTREFFEFNVSHGDLYHAVFHEAGGTGSDEPFERCRDLVADLLEGGVAAEEFDVADTALAADFLLHALYGAAHEIGHHRPEARRDESVAELVQLVRAAVRAC